MYKRTYAFEKTTVSHLKPYRLKEKCDYQVELKPTEELGKEKGQTYMYYKRLFKNRYRRNKADLHLSKPF